MRRFAIARPTCVLPLLAGWWLGATAAEVAEVHELRAAAARPGPWPRVERLGALPALPYPRALRAARGVGRRRSVDLARYLWDHGPDAAIEALSGFGPKTAAAAREVLEDLARSP